MLKNTIHQILNFFFFQNGYPTMVKELCLPYFLARARWKMFERILLTEMQ